MITGRFMILGTEHSGKSALLASFPEQVNRVHSLNVRPGTDLPAIGMSGQETGIFQVRVFDVYQGNAPLINLRIADYSGEMLSDKPDSPSYEALNAAVYHADVLYILVDGELFLAENTEKKLRNVKRKCARIITPYVSEYSKHNNGVPPKVIFIVTKSRLIFTQTQTTMGEIRTILKEAFNYAFDSENANAVQPYAVCVDTSDENSSVQIPFLTGMYYVLHKYGIQLLQNSEAEKQRKLNQLQDNQRVIRTNESMNIVSRKLRQSQTKELQSANAALRSEMWQNEAKVKSDSVWNSKIVVRNALQNELVKYQGFLLSDFTKGDLDIIIPKYQKNKRSGFLDLHKPTGKEIGIAALFAVFSWIGIVGVCVYAKKKNHTICLLIVLMELAFCMVLMELAFCMLLAYGRAYSDVRGLTNPYLYSSIIGGIILMISGLINTTSSRSE